jgi:hypothetical protein
MGIFLSAILAFTSAIGQLIVRPVVTFWATNMPLGCWVFCHFLTPFLWLNITSPSRMLTACYITYSGPNTVYDPLAQMAGFIMPPICGAGPPTASTAGRRRLLIPLHGRGGCEGKNVPTVVYCLLFALVSASRFQGLTPYIEHLPGSLFQGGTPDCQWWSRVL